MPSPTLQFKRGILANLPGLKAGEPGFTTDSYDLYVGIDSTTANNQFVGSGRYWSINTATSGSGVKLVEGTDNGTNFINLKSPDSLSGITTYTFPASPTNGYYLKTNTAGELSWAEAVSSNITTSEIAAGTLVIESEGIGSNDNDTTIPTSAAVKDYVDNNSPASTVDISGDTGTATVSTGSTFAFTGTDPVVIAASGVGVTFSITDAAADGSTKGIAAFNADDFDASSGVIALGDSANGAVLTISATANETTVARSNGTVTIGLPDDVTVTNNLTVSGNLYVNGSTTQVNTSTTTIEDQLLDLGFVDGSAPSSDLNKDIGVLFNYYSGSAKKASVYWDDSTSRVVVSADVSESSGVLTNNTGGALEVASLYVSGCTGSTVEVIGCSSGEVVITNATIDGGSF